jgi:hypothetical protein
MCSSYDLQPLQLTECAVVMTYLQKLQVRSVQFKVQMQYSELPLPDPRIKWYMLLYPFIVIFCITLSNQMPSKEWHTVIFCYAELSQDIKYGFIVGQMHETNPKMQMCEHQREEKISDWISNMHQTLHPFLMKENKKPQVFQLTNYGTFFGLWPNELWDI